MQDPFLYRRWGHPEVATAEQLHGWLEDIHAARDFLARLRIELDVDPPDPVLIDALATATVIRYARCFASGNRGALDPRVLFESGEVDGTELHERLLGVRNWHVAHAINKQEAHTLMVIVDPRPEAPHWFKGFSSRSARELPIEVPDIAANIALCDRWIERLTEKLIRENCRLQPLAASLSFQELLALPDTEIDTNSDVRARRRQARNRPPQ